MTQESDSDAIGAEQGSQPEQPPEQPPDEPHSDHGLDLARSVTAATSASSPAQQRRIRGRRPPGAGSRASGSRLSGAHPDDRDPQTLEGEVARLVGERGWELGLRLRGVFARWEELVGAEVAAHCSPETFDDGRLVVRTDSTAWATQLKLLTPTLVRRLNEELGAGTVTVIDVVGPHLPTWRKGPRSTRDGRGPRDTYG